METDQWQVVPRQVFTPCDCLLISVAFVFSVALVVLGNWCGPLVREMYGVHFQGK